MKNLLTEHMDIWTTAQIQKNGAGRGNGSAKQNLHGIKKLRELILELAVRGKLVPQDPHDEPANVLLEKIAREKARLIKEGKLKKQEPWPEITAEEKPFELPKGWEWQRLGDIGITQTGGTPSKNSKAFFGNDIPFIKPGDIYPTYIDYSNEGLSFEGQTALGRTAPSGSILMVCIGTIGKCNSIDRNCAFNQQINTITPYINMTKYLLVVLRSNYFQGIAWAKSSSTTIAILNKGKWADIVLPVAPLVEQNRIVAKVDELMAICDQLEQKQTDSNAAHQTLVETLLATLTSATNHAEFVEAWQRIASHFDILFTTEQSLDQLKQTILQLAVMGKLVPQDPNDEPASVLLEKIAKEKSRLIKEGEIKKEKPLPAIAEDEKPFALPGSWTWTRLGDCIALISGQHLIPQEYNEESSGIPYLTGPAEFGHLSPMPTRWTHLRKAIALKGDIVLTVKGAGVGKINLVTSPELAISRQLMAIRSFITDKCYVYIYLQNIAEKFQSLTTGIAIPGIGRDDVNNRLFQLPPLAEQHRIVAKVDELMTICDKLKARLQEAQTTQIHLADAIVEQAVT